MNESSENSVKKRSSQTKRMAKLLLVLGLIWAVVASTIVKESSDVRRDKAEQSINSIANHIFEKLENESEAPDDSEIQSYITLANRRKNGRSDPPIRNFQYTILPDHRYEFTAETTSKRDGVYHLVLSGGNNQDQSYWADKAHWQDASLWAQFGSFVMFEK